jgi:hypothetical protein
MIRPEEVDRDSIHAVRLELLEDVEP